MTNCVSNFGQLNSLFSTLWISVIRAFGWSLECLINHISAQSYNALTSVVFLMLSTMIPCSSHTALTTNQNWSGSSFPIPLNIGSLIALTILNCGIGGGGVGDDGDEIGEVGEGVREGDSCRMCCLFKLTTLLEETWTHSSSLAHGGEIKGLFLNPSIPLYNFSAPRRSTHQCIRITHFSHNNILIQAFRDLMYLPRSALRKRHSALL